MFELRSTLMKNFTTPVRYKYPEDPWPMHIEDTFEVAPDDSDAYTFEILERSVLHITVNADTNLEISLSDDQRELSSIGWAFFAVTASQATCEFGVPYTGNLRVTLFNTGTTPATGSIILDVDVSGVPEELYRDPE